MYTGAYLLLTVGIRSGRKIKNGEERKDMATPLLQLVNIRKEFPGVLALDKVNLDIQEGEVLALVGENGSSRYWQAPLAGTRGKSCGKGSPSGQTRPGKSSRRGSPPFTRS